MAAAVCLPLGFSDLLKKKTPRAGTMTVLLRNAGATHVPSPPRAASTRPHFMASNPFCNAQDASRLPRDCLSNSGLYNPWRSVFAAVPWPVSVVAGSSIHLVHPSTTNTHPTRLPWHKIPSGIISTNLLFPGVAPHPTHQPQPTRGHDAMRYTISTSWAEKRLEISSP